MSGDVLDFTAPSGGVTSGDVVVAGKFAGVAAASAAEGETASINLKGVYELPKAAQAFTQGALLYWDDTNDVLTTTSTSNTFIGHAWYAAQSGDATGFVKLCPATA